MNVCSNWFASVWVAASQGYVSWKCICWKIFEQIGIAMAHPHVFSITMHEIDTTKEVYLEPFQTYML